MIQRKQTVFLALAAVILGTYFVLPGQAAPGLAWTAWLVPALALLVGLGGILAIFQYTDRPRQRATVVLLQYGAVLVLAAGLVLTYLFRGSAQPQSVQSSLLGVAPAVVAYVLYWLARRGIEQDIALVRSMDRLR